MATALSLYRQPARRHRRSLLDVDRFFDEVAPNRATCGIARRPERYSPRVEALEAENEYRIMADLPGVQPDDLSVTVDDGILVIKGERKWTSHETSEDPASEGEAKTVVARRFERRFSFDSGISADGIPAEHRHGVLTVTVPKHVEPEPVPLSISVEVA